MSHFKLISSTKASDVIPVTKYVSEKTGLTVIIASVEGPLVNGFFCLATEAHDDDGLPHTLEHLIFLGSKRYPYKGILDLLANRCMAHGTNAWTDTDHTCYTIDTAGDAGMLTLLPIYIDHILQPTLTDEGFITEVHHVDGDGADAGVVYCEMQGRENTADSRCELKLQRAMYPNNGYSAETGGIMKNLRESTTNKKVRDFHKKFYRAENLTIILTGQIEAKDVFDALKTVEDDIIAKRNAEPQEEWVKPWQTIPPPPNYGELKELWPADTEDCGQVYFGWRGPLLRDADAMKSLTGCAVLLRYLCDTAAAPLQRQLVQREDALAGDVSYGLTENMAALIKIELNNVPINKLEQARDEALECLKKVRDGEESLDMERIVRLVQKQLRESIASLESDPHHALAFRCIGDALYSLNESDFISRMNPQHTLSELMEENVEYWQGLLQKYFTDERVTIVGAPSIELQNKMAEDEKNRIEQQRAELGEGGLAERAKQLQEAMEFNERFEQAQEQYWQTWSQEHCEQISKVMTPNMDHGLKIHDLVILKEDGPPVDMYIGRIERIFPGLNGDLFDIITARGMVRRSIHGLKTLGDQSKPEDGSNDQGKPQEGSNDQTKPGEASKNQAKPEEGSNNQTMPEKSSNGQTKREGNSNVELKSGDNADVQTKSKDDFVNKTKPGDDGNGQTKSENNDQTKPKDSPNDQTKAEDNPDSQINPADNSSKETGIQ